MFLAELDSYMYQTVGHEGIEKLAEAMGLPLYRQTTQGCAKQTGRSYRPEEGDEVEDLFTLLSTVKVNKNKVYYLWFVYFVWLWFLQSDSCWI